MHVLLLHDFSDCSYTCFRDRSIAASLENKFFIKCFITNTSIYSCSALLLESSYCSFGRLWMALQTRLMTYPVSSLALFATVLQEFTTWTLLLELLQFAQKSIELSGGPETKLLTDLNRNIAQVQSSRWNYHYSAGTASVVLELPRLKILHFLSNEERLVNIFFYTGTINKGPVYHCYREIDKEMSISSVLTNN